MSAASTQARRTALAWATQADKGLSDKARSVLNFWFGRLPDNLQDASPEDAAVMYFDACGTKAPLWWAGGEEVDKTVTEQFGQHLSELQANPSALNEWVAADNPRAGLAAILVTDQFSRNVFRRSKECFAFDNLALSYCRSLVDSNRHHLLRPVEFMFCIMPLEHSEDLEQHELMKKLISERQQQLDAFAAEGEDVSGIQKTLDEFVKFQASHEEVLQRFGRYPHRNKVLGRESTPEEVAYLEAGANTWGQ